MMPQDAKPQRPKVKLPKEPPRTPRATISVEARAKIRGKSMVDERVIARWAAGAPVRPSTCTRIERACRELGIELLA